MLRDNLSEAPDFQQRILAGNSLGTDTLKRLRI